MHFQLARMSTGGPTLNAKERARRRRQFRKEEKAWEAKKIAARYTAEARDERAVRRAEQALKREAEKAAREAAKKTKKGKKTIKKTK